MTKIIESMGPGGDWALGHKRVLYQMPAFSVVNLLSKSLKDVHTLEGSPGWPVGSRCEGGNSSHKRRDEFTWIMQGINRVLLQSLQSVAGEQACNFWISESQDSTPPVLTKDSWRMRLHFSACCLPVLFHCVCLPVRS